MANKTVRLDHSAFIPRAFIIVPIKGFLQLRIFRQILIIAVPLAVIFHPASAGMTGAAGGLVPGSRKPHKIVGRQVNLIRMAVLLFVAKGRKLPVEKVRPLADGRVFDAETALKSRLIDGIGYYEDAVKKAEELADITEATIIQYRMKRSFLSALLKSRSPTLPLGLDEVVRYMDAVPTGVPLYVWPPAVRAYQKK